jgi:hypothetical protein
MIVEGAALKSERSAKLGIFAKLPATSEQSVGFGRLGDQSAGELRRSSVRKFVRKKSHPNCRGVIDPVAFFGTESLS